MSVIRDHFNRQGACNPQFDNDNAYAYEYESGPAGRHVVVDGLECFRSERHHLIDGIRVGQQHDQPVEAQGIASGRGHVG
jgi:hypothetical protein